MTINESKHRKFMEVDLGTLKVLKTIKQVESVPLLVTKMARRGEQLVYILGKALVIQSMTHGEQVRVVNRQSHLVSLALSSDASTLAVGDDFGKIYLVRNLSREGQLKI
jgi:hypothetical protein